MRIFKLTVFLVILLAQNAFADTKTTADVTEDSAGAETSCSTRCTNYNFDPRTDIAQMVGMTMTWFIGITMVRFIQTTIMGLTPSGRLLMMLNRF